MVNGIISVPAEGFAKIIKIQIRNSARGEKKKKKKHTCNFPYG